MDKRYFLIILIICICGVNLYMISNVSDVVGSAYVDVGHYTFSLPEGLTLSSDEGNQVTLLSSDSKTKIYVMSSLKKNDVLSNKIEEVKKDGYQLDSNGTINYEDINIDSAFYHKGSENKSTCYFTKDNTKFRILIIGFDYDSQKEEMINISSQIAGSMRLNHKVS